MKHGIKLFMPKHEGAVAAPTAGFHFSRELMKRLEILGVNFAEVTLHAGLGNFRILKSKILPNIKWIPKK